MTKRNKKSPLRVVKAATRIGCDRWGTRYELTQQSDGTWRGEMASRSGDGPLPFVVAANVAAEWFRRAETPGIESGRAL